MIWKSSINHIEQVLGDTDICEKCGCSGNLARIIAVDSVEYELDRCEVCQRPLPPDGRPLAEHVRVIILDPKNEDARHRVNGDHD